MFRQLQFVLIGKFEGYKHINLKDVINNNGGKCVVNCSKNVDYVILPDELGNVFKYLNNKQIKFAQKVKIPIIHLKFIFDCIKKKSILNHCSYNVKLFEIYELNFCNFWEKWFCERNAKYFYYNKLTGLTQWECPYT